MNNGSVMVTPEKAQYDEGEIVELIPKPDTGYYFTGWTGDVVSNIRHYALTMNANKSVTAHFAAWQPPLGIPAPSFGITETYRMYDDADLRTLSGLPYQASASGGY